MHRIKVEGLTPARAPGRDEQPFPTTLSLGGIVADNIRAAVLGQCACGQVLLGIRYEADRDSEVTTNLPCGHTRGPA
ncbi:hypothetical protein [Streptomyces sp. TBY4]|uniref:hypothetical protein n=1 Tax=Streptomyces sp. TBY4 TaxID=2962030 RepID=UPI0020B68D29|nr:hypothetical protein [Streptomyces sp. TBY4]MCP3758197.1 hypothetical protein [Streptomyces sp. TBY4]